MTDHRPPQNLAHLIPLPTTRLAHFDAARAVAATLVVAVHTQQYFGSSMRFVVVASAMGQLGVQLFFVVSGYLIFESLDRLQVNERPITAFFIHRYLRIAPAYYFAIAANTIMWCFIAPDLGIIDEADPGYTLTNLLANIALLHGLIPSANQSIVGGGWSIGTECLFYAVAPALFLLRQRPFWLIAIAGACYVLVYVAVRVLQERIGEPNYVNDNGFLYYSIANQLPVFVCGALMFSWRNAIARIATPALIVGVCLPLSAAYYIWTSYFTGLMTFAAVPTLAGASSVFLIALLSKVGAFGWLISEMGKRSFSMYLWSFPVLMLVRRGADIFGIDLRFFAALPIVLTGVFLAAGTTYYAIERPFMTLAKRLTPAPSCAAPAQVRD